MTASRTKGFTLIEVLVAMLVLTVGILGAGALQTVGLQNSMGAFTRSQAMFIAGDVIDRMRANRPAMASYVGTFTASSSISSTTCDTAPTGCTPAQLVNVDLAQIVGYFKTIDNGGIMPGGSVTISQGAGSIYTVVVNWSEREWQGGTYEQTDSGSNSAKSYSVAINLAAN